MELIKVLNNQFYFAAATENEPQSWRLDHSCHSRQAGTARTPEKPVGNTPHIDSWCSLLTTVEAMIFQSDSIKSKFTFTFQIHIQIQFYWTCSQKAKNQKNNKQ